MDYKRRTFSNVLPAEKCVCAFDGQPIRNVQCINLQRIHFLLPTCSSTVGSCQCSRFRRVLKSRIGGGSEVGCPVTVRSLSLVTTLGLLLFEGITVMEVRAKCDDRLSHFTLTSLPYFSDTAEIARFNESSQGAILTGIWCTFCQRHWDNDMRSFIEKPVAIWIVSIGRIRSIHVHLLDTNAILKKCRKHCRSIAPSLQLLLTTAWFIPKTTPTRRNGRFFTSCDSTGGP